MDNETSTAVPTNTTDDDVDASVDWLLWVAIFGSMLLIFAYVFGSLVFVRAARRRDWPPAAVFAFFVGISLFSVGKLKRLRSNWLSLRTLQPRSSCRRSTP